MVLFENNATIRLNYLHLVERSLNNFVKPKSHKFTPQLHWIWHN